MADTTFTFEGFLNALVNQLAEVTGVSASKLAKAINEFEFNIQGEVKPTKKKTPAKPKVKASDDGEELEEEEEKPKKAAQAKGGKKAAAAKDTEKHQCERIQHGKEDPCGKNAKNEVNGHWYCGTENSGCYKSILGSIKRNEKADKKKPAAEPAKKPATKKVKSASEVNTRKINGHIVDPERRIVFDKEGTDGVAQGILAQDNKTIAPLTKKDIAWLEASGIAYLEKPPKKAAASKKTASKEKPKKAAVSKKKKASSDAEEEEDEVVETDEEVEVEEEEEEEVEVEEEEDDEE